MSLAIYYAIIMKYEKIVEQINYILANGANSKQPKFLVLKKKAHLAQSLSSKARTIIVKLIVKEDEEFEYDQIYTDILAQCSYWLDCSNRFFFLAKNGY
jgi:hypothetical protein